MDASNKKVFYMFVFDYEIMIYLCFQLKIGCFYHPLFRLIYKT